MKPIISIFSLVLVLASQAAEPRPKPKLQYESDDIQITIPTADEPKATSFTKDSVQAISRYLNDGAVAWVREKSCINCHTTGPYMSERPALSRWLGNPNEEVRADFLEGIPDKPGAAEAEKDGLRYVPGSWTSIWRSMGLAEWDKHVTGKLSPETAKSLVDMLHRQSPDGSFVSYGEVEIPHITTDFELSLQAARAITAAPGWLASLTDTDLRTRVEKLKSWLKSATPKNDFDRVLKLQLAAYMPELVSQQEKDSALALLSAKQHADGSWSTRDMSPVNDWHFKMSETVLKLINGLPDAQKPQGDAYMTALAVVLLRQSGVATNDQRVEKGIAWLKSELRQSGRWWMHSLYRGNYHYITYIATAQAMKALAVCDELPALESE